MVFDIDEINNSWLNMIFGFGSKEVLNKLFKTVPEHFWDQTRTKRQFWNWQFEGTFRNVPNPNYVNPKNGLGEVYRGVGVIY